MMIKIIQSFVSLQKTVIMLLTLYKINRVLYRKVLFNEYLSIFKESINQL